jgi:pimeloyl-ACP methyl ester carboxylesterase
MRFLTLRSAAAQAAAALCLLATAAAPAFSAPVKNIVVVHGAFADAAGWRPVYNILTKDGYHVTLVQQPLTSFNDDVTATKRVLDSLDGPCVLVGHSYAGAIISEAGNDDHVTSLATSPRTRSTRVKPSGTTARSILSARYRSSQRRIILFTSSPPTIRPSSHPTCLARRPSSKRMRRYRSRYPSSPHRFPIRHGKRSPAGIWSRRPTRSSVPTSNACTQSARTRIRSRSMVQAMRCSNPIRGKSPH